MPTERVPQILVEERDLGADQERDRWRAEAERMIEEYRANAEKESFEYKDNWNAAADGLEELLKNMEARK